MPQPWAPGEGGEADKRHAPATLRNRDAIAAVLADWLPPSGIVLEVASGSGEHVIHFAAAFSHLDWQPSDPDPAGLTSIAAWRAEAGLANIPRSDEHPSQLQSLMRNSYALLCL